MKYKSIILSIIGFSSILNTNGITESESPKMSPIFQTFSPTSSSLSPTSSPTSSPTPSPTQSSTLETVEREIINDVSSASDEINHAILLKCIVLFNTVCILFRNI